MRTKVVKFSLKFALIDLKICRSWVSIVANSCWYNQWCNKNYRKKPNVHQFFHTFSPGRHAIIFLRVRDWLGKSKLITLPNLTIASPEPKYWQQVHQCKFPNRGYLSAWFLTYSWKINSFTLLGSMTQFWRMAWKKKLRLRNCKSGNQLKVRIRHFGFLTLQ